MDDFIKEIENEITSYRRQEETSRAKREALEQLLHKIKRKNTSAITSDEVKDVKNRTLSASSKELIEVVTELMSDGNPWQLADILKGVSERLGRKVASSTLRHVLKNNPRFEKSAYGQYVLVKINELEIENQDNKSFF